MKGISTVGHKELIHSEVAIATSYVVSRPFQVHSLLTSKNECIYNYQTSLSVHLVVARTIPS